MVKNTWTAMALLVCGAFIASPLAAQSQSLSLEGRVGTTLPVSDLSDSGAEAGLLFEGELIYTPSLNFSVFGGAGMHMFNCEADGCEEFSTRGLHGGVKYLFGQSGTALPWLRAGVLLHEAEVGDRDSGFSPGFEAGAGIDMALSEHFSLTPSLRYHQYSPDFGNNEIDMSWFSLALGAHYHF